MVLYLVKEWSVRDIAFKYKGKPEFKTVFSYYNKFRRLGINTFRTVIEGIDERIPEKYLFDFGTFILWEHKQLGLVVSKGLPLRWNVNNQPTQFRPLFDHKPVGIELPDKINVGNIKDGECIVFYDCLAWDVKRKDILLLIEDIADIRETIRTQVQNQKTPLLAIAGDKKVKDKLKKAIIDIQEGMKALFLDIDITDNLKPLDLNAPFNIEILNSWCKVIENQILEYLGIDSQDAFMKKERKIVDEIEGNDELLNYFLADCLRSRQISIDECMRQGIKASTEINPIVRPIYKMESGNDDSETE